MEKHVTILGAFFLAFGVMGLVGITVVLIIFGVLPGIVAISDTPDPDEAFLMLSTTAGFGGFIALIIGITHIPAFFAGYGLLKRLSWARIVALIVAFINLPALPFGTALGVYAIWVLMKDETMRLLPAKSAAEPTESPVAIE